jgi:hypothetical protein
MTILGIDPGKSGAVAVLDEGGELAIAQWPARADLFARECDVDRAEACLIALVGLKREACKRRPNWVAWGTPRRDWLE